MIIFNTKIKNLVLKIECTDVNVLLNFDRITVYKTVF